VWPRSQSRDFRRDQPPNAIDQNAVEKGVSEIVSLTLPGIQNSFRYDNGESFDRPKAAR